MNDMAAVILISIGVLFNVFGCIGLLRLPDVYNRLQAATKCVTLGCCSILIGVMVHFGIGGACGRCAWGRWRRGRVLAAGGKRESRSDGECKLA